MTAGAFWRNIGWLFVKTLFRCQAFLTGETEHHVRTHLQTD
jgi:hypothetical protein